jgi:hypothetical protein
VDFHADAHQNAHPVAHADSHADPDPVSDANMAAYGNAYSSRDPGAISIHL